MSNAELLARDVATIADGLAEALREIAALHRRIEDFQGEHAAARQEAERRLRAIQAMVVGDASLYPDQDPVAR